MKLALYVDASDVGLRGALIGDVKVLVLHCSDNPQQFHYSSDAKLEGLVSCCRAFKNMLISCAFTICNDKWAVFCAIKDLNHRDYVLRRLSEIMSWYPQVEFVVGYYDFLVDVLSRFPLVKLPSQPVSLPPLHFQAVVLCAEDDWVYAVEEILRYGHWSDGSSAIESKRLGLMLTRFLSTKIAYVGL